MKLRNIELLPIGVGLAVLTLGVGNAGAAAVLIDTFSEDQMTSPAQISDPAVATASSSAAAASAIGGVREITATKTGGDENRLLEAKSDATFDSFVMTMGSGVTGKAVLDYDGTADGSFDPTGLGGIDLVDGTNTGIQLVQVFSDQPGGSIKIDIFSSDGSETASRTLALPATNVAINYFLSFNTFAPSGAMTVDDIITNAGAVQVTIDGGSIQGYDVEIDLINATVPEPSRALLAMAGLMAGGFLRRRRR